MTEQHTSALVERRAAALNAYEALTDSLERLSDTIRRRRGAPAMVWPVPAQQEIGVTTHRWNEEALADADARAHAGDVIASTKFGRDQHHSTAVRAPGVIVADAEMRHLAAEANDAKRVFERAVRDLWPTRLKRSEILREMIPNIALRQCVREIEIFDERPAQIRFTWAGHTSKSSPARCADVVAELRAEQASPSPPVGYEADQWAEIIGYAIARLSGIPENEVIVTRKPAAPHPRANIVYADGTRAMVAAPMPFMVPDDAPELPLIGPLPPLRTDMPRAPRRDRRIEDEPIAASVGLFRYREEHRYSAAEGESLQAAARRADVKRAKRATETGEAS